MLIHSGTGGIEQTGSLQFSPQEHGHKHKQQALKLRKTQQCKPETILFRKASTVIEIHISQQMLAHASVFRSMLLEGGQIQLDGSRDVLWTAVRAKETHQNEEEMYWS